MADLYVKAPDGRIVVIDSADAQAASDSGYTAVDDATVARAKGARTEAVGDRQAAAEGTYSPEGASDTAQAFAEKALSSATFGMFPGLDSPEAVAGARKLGEEHPGLALGAEFVGQLPAAIGTGAVGNLVRGAALGGSALLRAGALGADVALGAAVGGAQTEAEAARVAAEEFSWTDAAVAGVAGEVLGRGAVWGASKALGGARNLLARGERDLIAQDAAKSLTKGGWVGDYRVAQHADQYHNELAELAARDLDALEESFAEVSRQDLKRSRITRAVQDNPPVQDAIRIEAAEGLQTLRAALADELADAGGPAKKLLRQLDDRIAALEDGRTGRKLWRMLDENRQALQEYRQDLHQAYEANPGSAWLSREGLAAIDAAEEATRKALLREDAWGAAAARMQAEYNVPFHEKYFPSAKTVRGQLMFSPGRNAEGFSLFRGDPERVRRFLTRDLDAPDGHRLSEQFRDYLDGVEAVAKAGASDAPKAAHRTLESVRRLRRAVANAAQITEAVGRTKARAGRAGVGLDVAAGVAGAAAFGPAGLAFAGASRGLNIGHWLARAGERLGWGAGKPLSMAKLLGEDALTPPPPGAKESLVDDLLESTPPSRPPSGAPPAAPPPAPPSGPRPGGVITPAAYSRTEPAPRAGADATPVQGLSEAPAGGTPIQGLGEEPSLIPPSLPPRDAPTRFVGEREVGRGQFERLEMEPLRNVRAAQQREVRRLEALTQGEFRDVVRKLRTAGTAEARELAEALESQVDELIESELVIPESAARARSAAPAAGLFSGESTDALADAAAFYEKRAAETRPDLAKFLEKNKSSVRAGQAAAQDWWAQLVAEAPELPAAKSVAPGGPEPAGGMFAQRVGRQGGVTRGGFFQGTDGVVRYAKFAPLEHQLTEVANNQAYRDFGVQAIEQKVVKLEPSPELAARVGLDENELRAMGGLGEPPVALVSDRMSASWLPAEGLERAKVQPEAVREYIQGVPADIVLGNWDIANNAGNVLTNGRRLIRIDAGEAGANSLFQPQAKAEWEDAVTILTAPDRNAPTPTVETPHMLMHGTSLKEAKAPLLAGVQRIEAVVAQHGGMSGYVNHRFPHLDEVPRAELAKSMQRRLDFLKEHIDAIAGLALFVGASALLSDEEQQGAAAAGMLFARRVGVFKQARARLVADVAKRLFSATAQPAARTAARLVYSRAELAARQEEFRTWQSDPNQLVERVAEGFREAPPEQSGTLASGVFRTAVFLRERLPSVARLNAISLRQIPVSAEAMAKYARYEQAALRPREALAEAAAGGRLSTELLETLEALYPDLLAELRVGAIMQVRENGTPTTVQAKLSYARLFDGRGELADPAMSQTVANMAAYAYEQAVPPKPGGGPSSSGNVSHVAAAAARPAGLARLG